MSVLSYSNISGGIPAEVHHKPQGSYNKSNITQSQVFSNSFSNGNDAYQANQNRNR